MNAYTHLLLASLIALTFFNARANEEDDLIAVLKSSAGSVEKCEACKKLRLAGTEKSVPALAAVITEERVSQAARYALEGMRNPEAGGALREALGKTSGLIKAGIIDSLGWRCEPDALPQLVPLLRDNDTNIASTTASALGRIAGKEAANALTAAREQVPAVVRPVVIEALIRCAERSLTAKDRGQAESIYESLYAPAESDQVRVAAYTGLIRCAEDGGITRIKAALEGTDGAAQIAALKIVRKDYRNRDNGPRTTEHGQPPEITKLALESLPKAQPELQAALLGILQESGDPNTAPVVLKYAQSADPRVQVAALTALGDLGDDTVVPVLTQAATSKDISVQAAARNALAELRRGDVLTALIAELGNTTPALQLEVVRTLGARAEKGAVPELLRVAQNDRNETRKAALAALGNLAAPGDLAALVKLLAQLKNTDSRNDLRVVFEKIADRAGDKQKLDVAPIADGLAASDPELRKALLPISALFEDERLRASTRAALKDNDETIRASAARAVCDTRDVALLPDLLDLARHTTDTSLRSLTLEGVVRLASGESALPLQQRADALTAAMSLASRMEDKRMVLSGLAQTPHRVTLELAEKSASDAQIKPEAEQASLQIAQKLVGSDSAIATATLKRLAAEASSAAVRAKAQQALGKGK